MTKGIHGDNSARTQAAFFDWLARDGEALRFTPDDEPKLARLRARLGDLRGRRVLEPGCGAGPLTECLSRWVEPGGHVEAFDPSGEMLAECRRVVAKRKNVHLTQVRCEEAVFPDETFDRVICFRVFPHFQAVDTVLARFARWLRPDGRLYVVHWKGRKALAAIHGTHDAVAAAVLPPAAKLTAALNRHGFAIAGAIDDGQEYYVEAVRG
jgi:ubiquinone/menaquinone biosynthesis C-methylase UbiE